MLTLKVIVCIMFLNLKKRKSELSVVLYRNNRNII